MNAILCLMTTRYPELIHCLPDIELGFQLLNDSFNQGNKLLLCGNGGSAAIVSGGKLKSLCDVTICVPWEKTLDIQERHLPIYHALCMMLKEAFFPNFQCGGAPPGTRNCDVNRCA